MDGYPSNRYETKSYSLQKCTNIDRACMFVFHMATRSSSSIPGLARGTTLTKLNKIPVGIFNLRDAMRRTLFTGYTNTFTNLPSQL